MGKKLAIIIGWIFLILGVLGFIPNPVVGDGAILHADLNHNIVHLLSGIIILWGAYKAPMKVGMLLKVFGIVYLLIAVLGFLMADGGSILGLVEVNQADNCLHLVLAIVMLAAGFMAKDNKPMSMNSQPMGNMNMGGGMGTM